MCADVSSSEPGKWPLNPGTQGPSQWVCSSDQARPPDQIPQSPRPAEEGPGSPHGKGLLPAEGITDTAWVSNPNALSLFKPVSGDALKPQAREMGWPGLLVLDARADTGEHGPTAHLQTWPGTPVDKSKE